MSCDCPYAEGGSNCKHMVAVLFHFEEELSSKEVQVESNDIDVESELEFLFSEFFQKN